MSKYRRIKYEDRCQIYALSKRGSSQESIAEVLGVSQSAVSREGAGDAGADERRIGTGLSQEDAGNRLQLGFAGGAGGHSNMQWPLSGFGGHDNRSLSAPLAGAHG